jgi:hypothetical protein
MRPWNCSTIAVWASIAAAWAGAGAHGIEADSDGSATAA